MAVNQKEHYRNLIKKYNINFDGPIGREEWPDAHRTRFGEIRDLGKTEFHDYHENIRADSRNHPWREQTKRRALRIKDLAIQCRASEKNEAGWRLALESEILIRFTIEVVCKACRARLWRSELEPSLRENSQLVESLEERRKRRTPCSCPSQINEGPHEQGVSLLFGDRAEEAMLHDETVMADLPKHEKPDRVYGLRRTRELEQLLLFSRDKRELFAGKTIGECIKSSPFQPDGDPIVFPFLAVEAKSEKGRDSFSAIEVQTAFTVRTLLKLQQDLREAVCQDHEEHPLVWFLSYKGEQWRVSVAFISNEGGVQSYHIVDLWDGRIISTDGALQLLLIVDYIFDWARDIYRDTIILALRTLSATGTQTLTDGTDVLSKVDITRNWMPDMENNTVNKGKEHEYQAPAVVDDIFRHLDIPDGVIRDAKCMQSRFIALYITEDNFLHLFQSIGKTEKEQSTAQTILRCLTDGWCVTTEAIDRLEFMWTGTDRESSSLFPPTKKFLVCVTLTAYISPMWEQTRAMSCLAVSEDSIQAILSYAKQDITDNWDMSRFPFIENDTFVEIFYRYQCMSVQDNLLAAISRACLTTKISSKKRPENPEEFAVRVISKEETNNGTLHRFDALLLPDAQAKAHEFVMSVYNTHKIGRKEPSSPILRSSDRFDDQTLGLQILPSQWPPTDHNQMEKQKVIAVTSKNPSNGLEYPKFCLFVMDQSRMEDIIDWGESFEFERASLLQTHRLDPKPRSGWGRGWNKYEGLSENKGLFQRVTNLINYVQNYASQSNLYGTSSEGTSNSRTAWRLEESPRERYRARHRPVHLQDMVGSKDMSLSKDRQITSITVPNPMAQSGRQMAPPPSRENMVPDGDPGPSRTGRGTGMFETPDYENENCHVIREPSENDRASLNFGQRKRAYEQASTADPQASSNGHQEIHNASPRTSPKRQRTGESQGFSRDYVTEEELSDLVNGGYFK